PEPLPRRAARLRRARRRAEPRVGARAGAGRPAPLGDRGDTRGLGAVRLGPPARGAVGGPGRDLGLRSLPDPAALRAGVPGRHADDRLAARRPALLGRVRGGTRPGLAGTGLVGPGDEPGIENNVIICADSIVRPDRPQKSGFSFKAGLHGWAAGTNG